ncbi:hypothetical protein [Angustibacter aerolatus]|uniref:Uncharacterized protein n=1 Tax=Angustibacter aerolatus TaxID=1162965 RepID=A0ABQ6JLF7_9ACTN|nr:hypothetical protein [Angustibacter aerolatus]GMA87677.1 hypothetical protein GCM10025868_29270 [Angustibacter aerolatus]
MDLAQMIATTIGCLGGLSALLVVAHRAESLLDPRAEPAVEVEPVRVPAA